MALTLAQYKTRVLSFLMDSGIAIWTVASDVTAECLRSALDEYSGANPLAAETVLTLPGAGREIALASIAGLQSVHDVWWPYDSLDPDVWPPVRVRGFRLWWDDAQPVLFLDTEDGDQPQADDEVRVFYSKPHTIQDLDAAAVTTIPTDHESLLVLGASGFACFARSMDLAETTGVSAVSTPNYAALGSRYLKEFRKRLDFLRVSNSNPAGVSGAAFGAGWPLDEWDGKNN